MSVALLVEIANSYVFGVATENFLYLCFDNWCTTGFCLTVTFWSCLIVTFWRYGWKQVCFRNNTLDDTLDNSTPDGDNDFDDNNNGDNNNHNSAGNNDDK